MSVSSVLVELVLMGSRFAGERRFVDRRVNVRCFVLNADSLADQHTAEAANRRHYKRKGCVLCIRRHSIKKTIT